MNQKFYYANTFKWHFLEIESVEIKISTARDPHGFWNAKR